MLKEESPFQQWSFVFLDELRADLESRLRCSRRQRKHAEISVFAHEPLLWRTVKRKGTFTATKVNKTHICLQVTLFFFAV